MLLGWSPGGNQEIVKLNDAVKKFSIKKINKTAAEFSFDKLDWVNSEHIKKTDTGILAERATPFLKDKGYINDNFDRKRVEDIVKLFQSRSNTLVELAEWADFVFSDSFTVDPQAKQKYLTADKAKVFELLAARLGSLNAFDVKSAEESFRGLVKELNIQASDLVHPVRVALTGKSVGPGLFETMVVLGKEKTVQRLKQLSKSL